MSKIVKHLRNILYRVSAVRRRYQFNQLRALHTADKNMCPINIIMSDSVILSPLMRQILSDHTSKLEVITVDTFKFLNVFKRFEINQQPSTTPNFGFSKALNGFLMMMTQNGKLLYISDNAAEYLGHSMEDLLIHGDSVYDVIDKQDQQTVRSELSRAPTDGEDRVFLCRMNVARNARRQMRFGDQKVK
ncbi:jg21482 [Pararge aegeria aegeria]|uniref:Jg21482 protein n=1 Tax=Pararge aegeria aegeria TaxID=348720 RepID=A0A8S4RMA6_9NEOP|nr:jg21482 [Pararge aegeria aegeria]